MTQKEMDTVKKRDLGRKGHFQKHFSINARVLQLVWCEVTPTVYLKRQRVLIQKITHHI